jgi:catechol 2,3-dioxygenase-like lactoylglutathione lyase family enzyme
MQITLTSVMVEDQGRALSFYTTILGFERPNTRVSKSLASSFAASLPAWGRSRPWSSKTPAAI